ncbi:hypothetical protein Kpol_1064p8 [Vanderwaltozyma polyspora DSM 70294]|uniref:Type 2A phosphatase-associated protein 42 n=1 Tax=Vanderwaltozyma polyspora (strain ATCC 22028 / DSM 70294 / BCRC 21397 / CBS 2163 / NBRC 10782 / NRRL Y-8283 / UCD 57-17) TaxID=436907 RepID=A7TMD4_VANPO|nr:uncharacterized protein Kpol_1064p8 [Vanderwaltozyma polyspora DSM 70294]EDO16528.1 hypothetical protein Kpol_1064p8 [Vanderwaltozyma polyspora DSM 70294]
MSVSDEYASILSVISTKIDHTTLRQDSVQFQNDLTSVIARLLKLKSDVYSKLALFSKNETIEDVSTSSLKFLSIDYYLAVLCSKKQAIGNKFNNPLSKNRMKISFLNKSVQLYMQFIIALQDFEILDSNLSKKIELFEETYKPTLAELYSQPKNGEDLSGAQLKRQQKIEMFRATKAADEKLALLESKYTNTEDDQDYDKEEEDILRDIYLQRMKSLSYKTFNELEQILYEEELLNNFTQMSPSEMVNATNSRNDSEGDHERKSEKGYTERLETLNKPLLSKKGKVLRNFTLLDKRTELVNKVRGYGQYGPTMTVEEFLEKEFEEGRVLQGGEEAPEVHDSDDEKWQDEQTYKAREWDEFKEANAKGSGNTINRG